MFFSALGMHVHPLHPWLRLWYLRSHVARHYLVAGLLEMCQYQTLKSIQRRYNTDHHYCL